MEENQQGSGLDLSELFGGGSVDIQKTGAALAKHIVFEEAEIDQLETELNRRKANLEACKTQLCNLIRQAGLESITVEGGLKPTARIVRKYFKASGVSDEQYFDWLNKEGLGDIIKPYVHWQTLQPVMKEHEATGREIPTAIITISDTPTVTMYGKSKFLATQIKNAAN